MTEEDWREI
jgi:dynein heavy chain